MLSNPFFAQLVRICYILFMLKAVNARVIGRVQGVGFRYHAINSAESAGHVTGWVRNNDDGSVGIFAEGEQDVLDIFLGMIRQGPPLGRVDEMQTSWSDIKERRYGEFEIGI